MGEALGSIPGIGVCNKETCQGLVFKKKREKIPFCREGVVVESWWGYLELSQGILPIQ
jgi:hypothetical protein